MAEHVWTVLCRRALVDKFSNTLSLLEALEEIAVGDSPDPEDGTWAALPMEGTLVTYLIRSQLDNPEEVRLKISVVAPSGEVFPHTTISAVSLIEHMRSRHIFVLPNIPYSSPGIHRVEVFLEQETEIWEKVAAIPLTISRQQ